MEQGKFYRLPISVNGKIVVGRKYKAYVRFYAIDQGAIDIESVLNEENAFYGTYVHKSVPKAGDWILLGKKQWTMAEITEIPFLFRQNMFDYKDCALVHPAVLEATPVDFEKCIGLNRECIFDSWDFLRNELIAKLNKAPNEPWDELSRLKIPGVDKPR